MDKQSWTLIDVERDVYVDELHLDASELVDCDSVRISKRTLRGGLRDGVDVVEIDTGGARIKVIPTRGMSIWDATVGSVRFGWQAPVCGPVHPRFVPLFAPDGIGWLQGFDELLCRCGLESNGAPVFDDAGRLLHPLHGKIANTPAHRLELSWDPNSKRVELTGAVQESRLFHTKLELVSTISVSQGECGFRIDDRVTNLSANAAEIELLYHTNFGPPLLGEGASVVAPIERLIPYGARASEGIDEWDQYGPPTAGFTEQVYLARLATDHNSQTQAMLVSAQKDCAALLRFHHDELPTFTIWKNSEALPDGYVTGLEPGISFPNPKPFESQHGRTARLEPGASYSASLTLEFHTETNSVAQAARQIAEMQTAVTPTIERMPTPDWSPEA